MSVNWRQSEIYIVINDKSQGSIAKHICWDTLLHYKFITQFASERIFQKIGEHFGEVTDKMVDCVIRPIRLTLLSSKMQNLPDM